MRVDNRLISKKTFRIVSAFYFLIGVAIAVPATIVLYTEGSLKQELLRYWYLSIPVLSVPLFLSYIGLYYFFFSEDKFIVSISSKCVALGKIHSRFNQHIELPKDHIISYDIQEQFFCLKKKMTVLFRVNNTDKKKKFNISMLSKTELKELRGYMDGIVNANKKAV